MFIRVATRAVLAILAAGVVMAWALWSWWPIYVAVALIGVTVASSVLPMKIRAASAFNSADGSAELHDRLRGAGRGPFREERDR